MSAERGRGARATAQATATTAATPAGFPKLVGGDKRARTELKRELRYSVDISKSYFR